MPVNTKAVYEVIDSRCTDDIKLSLRKEAINVTYVVSKNIEKDKVSYTVNLYGITNNLVIKNSLTNDYLNNSIIKDIKPGSNLTLTIYASSNNFCKGYTITSKLIKIPYYNPYSTNDLCKGYEDYYLCKEEANITITKDEFESRLKSYILSIKKNETKDEEVIPKEDTITNYDFLGFIIKYRNYISGSGLVVLVLFIVKLISNSKKKRGIL